MSIVSKYEFERKYAMLDEACRQWYAFIQEDPSRADGEGFGQFYEELCSLKYEEYRLHPEEFDMQRTDYPIFLCLSEQDAAFLSSDLFNHVRSLRHSDEEHPAERLYRQLCPRMEQIENIEEGMVME